MRDDESIITTTDLRRAVARAQAEVVEIDDSVPGRVVIDVRFNERHWGEQDPEVRRVHLTNALRERTPIGISVIIRIASGGPYR